MSDLHSAITSAIGALKGPLHGGANEQVMRMVEEIKSPARAEAWIRKALADKARVMRSEEHTSELQSPYDLVCRLLLEKKNRHKLLIERLSRSGGGVGGRNVDSSLGGEG